MSKELTDKDNSMFALEELAKSKVEEQQQQHSDFKNLNLFN